MNDNTTSSSNYSNSIADSVPLSSLLSSHPPSSSPLRSCISSLSLPYSDGDVITDNKSNNKFTSINNLYYSNNEKDDSKKDEESNNNNNNNQSTNIKRKRTKANKTDKESSIDPHTSTTAESLSDKLLKNLHSDYKVYLSEFFQFSLLPASSSISSESIHSFYLICRDQFMKWCRFYIRFKELYTTWFHYMTLDYNMLTGLTHKDLARKELDNKINNPQFDLEKEIQINKKLRAEFKSLNESINKRKQAELAAKIEKERVSKLLHAVREENIQEELKLNRIKDQYNRERAENSQFEIRLKELAGEIQHINTFNDQIKAVTQIEQYSETQKEMLNRNIKRHKELLQDNNKTIEDKQQKIQAKKAEIKEIQEDIAGKLSNSQEERHMKSLSAKKEEALQNKEITAKKLKKLKELAKENLIQDEKVKSLCKVKEENAKEPNEIMVKAYAAVESKITLEEKAVDELDKLVQEKFEFQEKFHSKRKIQRMLISAKTKLNQLTESMKENFAKEQSKTKKSMDKVKDTQIVTLKKEAVDAVKTAVKSLTETTGKEININLLDNLAQITAVLDKLKQLETKFNQTKRIRTIPGLDEIYRISIDTMKQETDLLIKELISKRNGKIDLKDKEHLTYLISEWQGKEDLITAAISELDDNIKFFRSTQFNEINTSSAQITDIKQDEQLFDEEGDIDMRAVDQNKPITEKTDVVSGTSKEIENKEEMPQISHEFPSILVIEENPPEMDQKMEEPTASNESQPLHHITSSTTNKQVGSQIVENYVVEVKKSISVIDSSEEERKYDSDNNNSNRFSNTKTGDREVIEILSSQEQSAKNQSQQEGEERNSQTTVKKTKKIRKKLQVEESENSPVEAEADAEAEEEEEQEEEYSAPVKERTKARRRNSRNSNRKKNKRLQDDDDDFIVPDDYISNEEDYSNNTTPEDDSDSDYLEPEEDNDNNDCSSKYSGSSRAKPNKKSSNTSKSSSSRSRSSNRKPSKSNKKSSSRTTRSRNRSRNKNARKVKFNETENEQDEYEELDEETRSQLHKQRYDYADEESGSA